MLQLRLITPPPRTDAVLRLLKANPGVVSVTVDRGVAVKPEGDDLVVCDLLRECANEVIEGLEALDIDGQGELSIIAIDAARSDDARAARRRFPGRGGDVVVWEVLEERVHQDGVPSIAFFCFMAVAAVIATVGIVVDSSVLIVGAMVVGPEYGPLAALALALYRKRLPMARNALLVLLSGLALAILVSFVAASIFDLSDSRIVDPSNRFFTRFVTEPNAYSVIVAFSAGLVGIMAVGLGRSGALTGVVVSATTIPAAAAIGVNAADAAWVEVRQGAVQLSLNVVSLSLGSLAALLAYRFIWHHITDLPHELRGR